jgi:hypothetical protein
MRENEELLSKIRICRSTEVPEGALIDFYDRMFPQKSDLMSRSWKWLYRIEQFDDVQPPLVAVLDGAVIGQVAQVPVLLTDGDREQLAVWGVDYGVLPEYRRCGIGFQINEMWMQQYPIYLADCTPASYRIVLKQGWTPRQTTYDLKLPLRLESLSRTRRGLKYKTMTASGPLWKPLCRLMTMARSPGRGHISCRPLVPDDLKNWSLLRYPGNDMGVVHVARRFDFMRWRLLESPLAEQYRLIKMDNSPVVAIIRTRLREGVKQLLVLALSGHIAGPGDLRRFFHGLVRWAFQNGADVIRMVTSDPILLALGRRWFPFKRPLRFAYFCQSAESREFMDKARYRWELLDGDFDLLP